MIRRTTKQLILLSVTLLTASSLKGQINPATAFYWENPYFINPAFINTDYSSLFSLAARKQWISFAGSPVTLFGSATFFMEKYNAQAGIKILKDEIGYLNTMDISLSYAYSVAMRRNGALNMGFSLSHQSQQADKGKVTMEDPSDPVWAEIEQGRKRWNASVGFEYSIDRAFRMGFSTQNIFSFFKEDGAIFGMTNYLYGRYRTRVMGRQYRPTSYLSIASPPTYDMEWGLCLKQYEDNLQVDGVVSFYINRNTQHEKFQLSILGRSTGEFGVLAGVKLISEMKVLCSYDYNFKSLSGNTKGTFEVIISYPLFPGKCITDCEL